MLRSGCPRGRVPFRLNVGHRLVTNAPSLPRADFSLARSPSGDLDGDGNAEAALAVDRAASDSGSGDLAAQLAVVERDGANLRVLARVGPVLKGLWGYWIAGGILLADLRLGSPLGQPTAYRWNGSSFVQVGTFLVPTDKVFESHGRR